MSPLFHRDGDGSGGQEPGPGHLPSLSELGPRLDEVVNQDRTYSQWLSGLVTTRRGRAALADGTLGQILARVYPSPA
jgi:hypothetical protein